MQAREKSAVNWPLLFGVWVLIGVLYIVKAQWVASSQPLILDTDDAMRLTDVHDFLNGQAWYDNVQHRLNTPFGAEIHWSRLIDLPEAILLFLLRPLAGPLADTILAYVWPLLLLGGLLFLTAKLALRLVGREGLLAALILPGFSLITMVEFAPGRLDHHSAQILLTLAMIWCSIEALQRPRFAIGAGLSAITAIAIGVEGLPMLGAAIAIFGLIWVFDPRHAKTLRLFGLSLALGALVHLLIALPPERWFIPACDAISITYVLTTILAGLAFIILSILPLAKASPWLRLVVGLVAGAILIGVVAVLFPACLKGPYSALDPWLTIHWLGTISEAEPFAKSLFNDPTYPAAIALPPLLALLAGLWVVWGGDKAGRNIWLVYLAYLFIAILVMFFQIRAARVATSLAIPGGVWLIAAARSRFQVRPTLLRALGLVAGWVGLAGLPIAALMIIGLSLLPNYLNSSDSQNGSAINQCLQPSAFAGLAAMPPERLMTPIDLGAHILLYTPHAVVSAPYHRNQQGIRDTYRFFDEPIAQARALLSARGISLVVICPAMPEVRGVPEHSADSFVALYAARALPDWLTEVPNPDSPLKIYAVKPL